jgi:hypothetical protein
MNELAKFFAAMKRWGWGRTSFLLALFLLMKQFVTFDQALVLILLAALLDSVVRKEHLQSRRRTFGNAIIVKNSKRRL